MLKLYACAHSVMRYFELVQDGILLDFQEMGRDLPSHPTLFAKFGDI